jgi:hypothetical protein
MILEYKIAKNLNAYLQTRDGNKIHSITPMKKIIRGYIMKRDSILLHHWNIDGISESGNPENDLVINTQNI